MLASLPSERRTHGVTRALEITRDDRAPLTVEIASVKTLTIRSARSHTRRQRAQRPVPSPREAGRGLGRGARAP